MCESLPFSPIEPQSVDHSMHEPVNLMSDTATVSDKTGQSYAYKRDTMTHDTS